MSFLAQVANCVSLEILYLKIFLFPFKETHSPQNTFTIFGFFVWFLWLCRLPPSGGYSSFGWGIIVGILCAKDK